MNQTAFITGASRGIGRAIAEKLASEQFDLYLVCRKNITILEELAAQLEANYSIRCTCFQGNLGDSALVNELFAKLPPLDVLINNAGVSYVGLLQEMTDAQWKETMGSNLDSVFYCCRSAIPGMLSKGKGKIINISSVWGNQGASMEVAYSATKGGVNSFTRALAKELAPSGIQVNAIACGLIDTEMNAHLNEEELQDLINEIPADRIGQPAEVAAMAYQLITAPDYLTGQIIALDGGWM